ncbi:MAG TPA: 2-dehydropantoate 2-reductase [Perlabentimonas sp.]|nr:2-dehydropantoate 2-reductase [Bacteroidales bacterium]MDY0347407.1 2-dehydropantoate 2-reductase [Tenuifilaceae bacterium]HZJ73322.1 2-dehydropantoate 2-reductase [Perlabentimonas sp.]
MKIAIIGTGGVGGYFGAKMAQAGCNVTFLARGAHLEAIKRNGIKVKSILGDFHLDNVRAVSTIPEMGMVDLAIVSVKAWQVKDIRADLKLILHPNAIVLPLQNGIMAAQELGEVIDPKRVIGGLCRIISKIESPGVIAHLGVTPTIVFGDFNGELSQRVKQLKALFDKADFSSRVSDDIEADMWKKFISICVSGLLAVSKTTYGEIRKLDETRALMIGLIKEVYELSQRKGLKIAPDFIDRTVSFIDSFPPDTSSSLTRDVLEGKPSEIEYQNGTVVRLGQELGVSTPINRFVYSCILPMELRARHGKV